MNPILRSLSPVLLLLAALFPAELRAAGETVNINISNLPPGKTVKIFYSTTVESTLPSGASVISNQGTFGYPGTSVSTDDIGSPGGAADPSTTNAYNPAPAAGPDAFVRYPSSSLKIPVADLLSNDTDPGGNTPLTVSAVNYTGGNGASVSLSGGLVLYNPNGHLGADTFQYTLRNSAGNTSIGSVSIGIIDDNGTSSNTVAVEMLGGGGAKVTFAGIPGRSYRIQYSDTMAPHTWQELETVVANAQGRIIATDDPPLPPSRFYRTVSP